MRQFLGWVAIAAMVACLLGACSKDDGVNMDEPEVRLELLVDTVSFKVNGSFYFTEDLVRIDDRRTGAMAGSGLEVRYEVADEEVAQFGFYDWRELYGRGVGETKVYAYLEEMPEVQDSCLVQVLPIEGQGITISAREVELYVEEDTLLRAQVYPMNATYKEVAWSSSDESVAMVDESGMVTAVSAGEVVITAESVGELKAECRVTVKNVPVSSVSIPELRYGMGLVVGDELQLTYEVLPENAFNKNVSIYSSNESVVSIDENLMLHAHAKGYADVVIESEDGNARQVYSIGVKNITSYLEATSGKSSINIGGISRETVGSTLKNKSAYTVEVVSVAAYRGDEIIRAGGSDMLGSLAPGEERSFDMTASHWAYTPTFIWIIEFRGQLYQMVGGISIN